MYAIFKLCCCPNYWHEIYRFFTHTFRYFNIKILTFIFASGKIKNSSLVRTQSFNLKLMAPKHVELSILRGGKRAYRNDIFVWATSNKQPDPATKTEKAKWFQFDPNNVCEDFLMLIKVSRSSRASIKPRYNFPLIRRAQWPFRNFKVWLIDRNGFLIVYSLRKAFFSWLLPSHVPTTWPVSVLTTYSSKLFKPDSNFICT